MQESDLRDLAIGQIALQRGYVTPEQLSTALAEQANGIAKGRKVARSLGNILVGKGYITGEQLSAILRERDMR